MRAPALRVVLFDIDGTLVDTGGAGRRSFLAAISFCLQRPIPAGTIADFAGRTDPAILRTFLERAGIEDPDPALRQRICQVYIDRLEEELAGPGPMRVYPGVEALLERLASDPETRVGLLTGNFEEGARRKLDRFDLMRFFAFGAFGSDDEDRDRLVAIARIRAAEVEGRPLPGARVVLLGDTPLDIRCARAGGAKAIAVATGAYDADTLKRHRPDLLLPDLSDTEEVVRGILRLTGPPGGGPPTPRTAL